MWFEFTNCNQMTCRLRKHLILETMTMSDLTLAYRPWLWKSFFVLQENIRKLLCFKVTCTWKRDCNRIQTHNYLVRKRRLNQPNTQKYSYLTSLTKQLSVLWRTTCLWVRIPLQSLKISNIVPLSRKSFFEI